MCSCDMIDEYAQVWDEKWQKARKEHRCNECPFPIEKGETYMRVGSLFEGKWETFRRHKECENAGKMDKHCHSAMGYVREDLVECELDRGHDARRAWGRHLWRFRKHPKARDLRVKEVLDSCVNYAGEGHWE